MPVEETVPESVVEEEELGLVEPGSETFDGAANFIERTIQCIEPFDAVSFEVTPVNFPVYIKESKFNTNDDYDYGPFVVLETKLHNAKLAISSFVVNFAYEGTYVFGDFQTPETPQTIVFVTSEKNEVCLGQTQWPMTSENMKRFGFVKKPVTLKEFDAWLHYIPPFFIAVAFILCAVQAVIEARIEASELERRMRREKASATLRKYFKKKQDKFDKVDYLGDMYKLIKQTLDEIKKQIAENNRRTEEEGKDNMNTMLKEKYSVLMDLLRSGGDKDLDVIKTKVNSMLFNLRFKDGRSLQEVLESKQMQLRLKEEEAKLKEMEEAEKQAKQGGNSSDSFVSEDFSDSENDSFISSSSKTHSKDDEDAEKNEDEDVDLMKANEGLADDMLAHKAALRKKREEFLANIDDNLSQKQKDEMLKAFDDQQAILAAAIQKEQQDQDNKLKARLAARKKQEKKNALEANQEVEDKQLVITEIQDRIDHLLVEKDQVEEKGVNTKALKAEREEEYKNRMNALQAEQDEKIRNLREEYLQKVKNAKNANEKDKLLEEMGKRLKSVEANLADEKKRQEA